MKDIHNYFSDYSEFHKNPTNQVLHMIGVPLIMFGLFGLLAMIQVPLVLSGTPSINAALLLCVVAHLFYFKLSPKLSLMFAPFSFGLYFLSLMTPLAVCVGAFVVGWVVQLWGHKSFEHKAPAFMQNFLHLLIGPLWVFVKVFKIKY